MNYSPCGEKGCARQLLEFMTNFQGDLIITYICAYKATEFYIELRDYAEREGQNWLKNREWLRKLDDHQRIRLRTISEKEWSFLLKRRFSDMVEQCSLDKLDPLLEVEVDNLTEILHSDSDSDSSYLQNLISGLPVIDPNDIW